VDFVDGQGQPRVVHAADDAADGAHGDSGEGALTLPLVDDHKGVVRDAARRQPVEVAAEDGFAGLAVRRLDHDRGAAHAAREVREGIGEEQQGGLATGCLGGGVHLGGDVGGEARPELARGKQDRGVALLLIGVAQETLMESGKVGRAGDGEFPELLAHLGGAAAHGQDRHPIDQLQLALAVFAGCKGRRFGAAKSRCKEEEGENEGEP
jgi:hypothetical protein